MPTYDVNLSTSARFPLTKSHCSAPVTCQKATQTRGRERGGGEGKNGSGRIVKQDGKTTFGEVWSTRRAYVRGRCHRVGVGNLCCGHSSSAVRRTVPGNWVFFLVVL